MAYFAHEVVNKAFGEGFAAHGFSYWNGSGECERMRHDAAANLYDAISWYSGTQGGIAWPNDQLIAIVCAIAQVGENSRYSMSNTYDAIQDVVSVHMRASALAPEEQKHLFEQAAEHLKSKLPEEYRNVSFPIQPKAPEDIEVVGSATARLKKERTEAAQGGGAAMRG